MSDECKEAGLLVPIIDRNRCEAKGDCLRVCPYNVFELRALNDEEKAAQSFVGRMKTFFHGGKQAFAVRAADCHACGHCVSACPEKAITLQRPSGS
jgi:NAD-dependent dihydropyrimidine dehydrogenase PreA subunit